LNDDSDLPRKLFNGNKELRQQTLTQQWPTEEVLRPPDFVQQQDPLPKGWVSRFDQLSGKEYFFCEETEDLVFSREDLFRKRHANNSISSRRSVSSPARTSSTITTAASDRPTSSIRASQAPGKSADLIS
jgi:YHS domain-containing protein